MARKSYLLVTESDFEKATKTDVKDLERRETNGTRALPKTAIRETNGTLQTLATSTQDSEVDPVKTLSEPSISCVFIGQTSGGQGIRTLNGLPRA